MRPGNVVTAHLEVSHLAEEQMRAELLVGGRSGLLVGWVGIVKRVAGLLIGVGALPKKILLVVILFSLVGEACLSPSILVMIGCRGSRSMAPSVAGSLAEELSFESLGVDLFHLFR